VAGDGRRFVQGADGYVATIKRGAVTLRAGVDQGERPGLLVRAQDNHMVASACASPSRRALVTPAAAAP